MNKPKPAATVAAPTSAPVVAPAPEELTKPKAEEKAETVKVRVTLAHGDHLPNHVLILSPDEATRAVVAGWADDDAAGVAYAEEHEPQPEPARDEDEG